MPKRIVELPPGLEKLVWDGLRKGVYDSFDHLVAVALENQLKADRGPLKSWPFPEKSRTSIRQGKPVHPDNDLPEPRRFPPEIEAETELAEQMAAEVSGPLPRGLRTVEEPTDEAMVGFVLWGQYYRFLPVKVALRVLARSSAEEFPALSLFKDRACRIAEGLGAVFHNQDQLLGRKLGERISTSFPEANPKSRRRFQDQYLIYVRPSDRKLDGMCARLKFINLVPGEDVPRVGITQAGLEFAALQNPLLDTEAGGKHPLTGEESLFLIRHIASKLPAERQHMAAMMEFIGKGVGTRVGLNEKMGDYYASRYDLKRSWTAAHVNTMRAGLLSRLVELGLVERAKHGKEVEYTLSELGSHHLSEIPVEVG
jgi:hypothetical protein